MVINKLAKRSKWKPECPPEAEAKALLTPNQTINMTANPRTTAIFGKKGWGQNWTPMKSLENLELFCCSKYLGSNRSGVKV